MERAERARRWLLPLGAFAVLTLLAVCGLLLIRSALLKGARETGTAVAASCAAEEESSLSVYRTLLGFGASALEYRIDAGESRGEIEDFLRQYFTRVESIVGSVEPYVVLDGELIAARPWDGDSEYDYAAAPWYAMALEAAGEVVFTGVYTDAVYNRPGITAALSCADGAVLAFDILPEHLSFEAAELGEGDSFFLCDSSGAVIYAETGLDGDSAGTRDYLARLVEGISSGELDGTKSVLDLDGERRGVYYARLENGWYSIVTTPYDRILGELYGVSALLALMFATALAVIAVFARREHRLGALSRRADETAKVLGNTYYALYRVNYERETYEMIKGSDYVRSRIPASGPYDELLRTAGEVIEADAFRDFIESFSCENIRELVRSRARDFGGEFLRSFDGEYRWVSVRVLFDTALAPEEVVLCFREVEREKQRQLQEQRLLEESLRLARQNEEAKQAFFRNMSHDMRTPLNAILGSSELARRSLDSPERAAGYLDRIDASGRWLLSLINDILEMARMEHGKVQLVHREFDLAECLDDCAGAFRVQAEREGKTFREELDGVGVRLMGDAFRIQQVLNNLLSNAFKFTPAGGTITLGARRLVLEGQTQYEFTVSDTGIGMSAEFLERVFEPYAREERFGDRGASGTGLGMSITRSLVLEMGGEIKVESRPGEGSRFTVTLPLDECGGAANAPVRSGESFSLAGLRLLLAEDNEINMEITCELLAARGVETIRAYDGAEAVERFAESEPYSIDAVLMDMQMPNVDGCEAARRIRALERPDAATTPIVAVTANAFAEDVAATTAAGMDAHVSKPIDFDALAAALSRLIPGGAEKSGAE